MAKLTEIQGITKSCASKLSRCGMRSPLSMLKKAKRMNDRSSIAKKIGVPVKRFTQWVAAADFTRIRGIGGRFSNLLQCCGIGNLKQLARTKPETLLKKMKSLNTRRHYVKQLPSQKQVSFGYVVLKVLIRL